MSRWNENLHHFLGDPVTIGAVALVVALFVATCVLIFVQYGLTRRRLGQFARGLRKRIQGWNERHAETGDDPFWHDFKRVFIFRPETSGRVVVGESPLGGLTRRVLRYNRAGFFGGVLSLFGEHLTAIALIITFGLLALVLIGPIYSAVTSAAGAEELANGLRLMGAKFFVSATGIFGAWLFHFFSDMTDEWLEHRTAEVVSGVEDLLETVPSFQARMAYAGAQQLRKLESITVSVQGIGNEVTAHIGTIMKQQVANTICDAIAELRNSAQEIAASVQAQLVASFGQSLSSEVTRLQGGLEAVQHAIEGQSQSNLERIVVQLRDVVSGGFSSQSEDMGRQIGQLASTLPKLETQFAAMTDSLGRNAHQWGEENHRAVLALSNQVVEVVQRFEGVRTGMEGAVASLTEASHRTVQSLSDAATNQAQAINREMSTFRRTAAEDTAAFEQHTRGFVELVAKGHTELAAANGLLRDTVTGLTTAVQQVGRIQSDQRSVLQALEQAAQTVAEGGRRVGAVIEQQPAIIEREQRLLQAQREAVDRVASVLDGMLKRYSDALAQQSSQLADSWNKLAQTVKHTVEMASLTLSESVDELNQTVNGLKHDGGPRA